MEMRRSFEWIIFLLLCYHTTAQDEGEEDDENVIKLELADFDLIDAYDEISEASRNYLLNLTAYEVKIKMEKDLGNLLRLQSKTNNDLNDLPYEYNRKWDLLTKTGNFLLPKNEYEKLINFSNANEELSLHSRVSRSFGNSSEMLDTQGYLNALATERNATMLSNLWSSRQDIYYSKKEEFFSVLSLLNETYMINEEASVKSFWETQSEYENGYQEAHNLWTEIQPLYKTIYDFVKLRLQNHYGLSEDDDSIPVYLLGSNFGDDWSHIADIVSPQLNLYSDVNSKLKKQSVKSIYKLAEGLTHKIGLGTLGKQFWKKSNFNFSSCGPYIFSHCNKGYTEIITCDELDFTKFMEIHETAMNVVLRNQDYLSLARREMRYSAVDEALQSLGSLIAIDNLHTYGFVSREKWLSRSDEENIRGSALLMVALKVLPKLPYYLLVDTWRLNQLESSGDNITENWWMHR
ncbi:hypothetical protein FQR65_LT08561 [Abscondita terminalis]|nr:hypothetical protein FQR65_LT08561 [Abscondita terminalis]